MTLKRGKNNTSTYPVALTVGSALLKPKLATGHDSEPFHTLTTRSKKTIPRAVTFLLISILLGSTSNMQQTEQESVSQMLFMG